MEGKGIQVGFGPVWILIGIAIVIAIGIVKGSGFGTSEICDVCHQHTNRWYVVEVSGKASSPFKGKKQDGKSGSAPEYMNKSSFTLCDGCAQLMYDNIVWRARQDPDTLAAAKNAALKASN